MSSSSPSSSSGSSRASTPKILKRKRQEDESSDSSDSETSSAFSDSETEKVDVPVLSHKERRQQKKKEKSLASLSKIIKEKESPKARQNSVWVGNLLFKTTPDALRHFFDGVGEITRVHMPMKPGGKPGSSENRGFAYVDFATPEAKAAAVAKSEGPLLGRRLLIKDGGDFAGRPQVEGQEERTIINVPKSNTKSAQRILKAQKQPPAPTLFLGNLGFKATEEAIRHLFAVHRYIDKKAQKKRTDEEGNVQEEDWIRKVRLGTFEDSGLCKGFAFVDFSSIEHATSVLINPKNHQLDGRTLVVEYASPDAVRRGASKPSVPVKITSGPPRKKDKYSKETRPPKRPRTAPSQEKAVNQAEEQEQPQVAKPERSPSQKKFDKDDRDRKQKGPKSRPKPGAALAMANRQSAAIVANSGSSKKITF